MRARHVMAGLVALLVSVGVSSAVHAAGTTQVLAGRVTLSDGNVVAVSATRSNNQARGTFQLVETNGAVVQGQVVCLSPIGEVGAYGDIAATVTHSTDLSNFPPGSMIGGYFASSLGSAVSPKVVYWSAGDDRRA